MEEWNTLVRTMEDDYENPKQFQELAKFIFRWLTTHKIKDRRKFEQRLGADYEQLIEDAPYPDELVKNVLEQDDFFELSLSLTRK